MKSNPPSLIIRLFDDFISISCDSTDHLYNVCFNNDFINKDESIKGGIFEIHNVNELGDFGEYLRSNNYPYAVFRGNSSESIDYWYPTDRSTLSTIPSQYEDINQQEIDNLRSCGYVTIKDIKRESSVRLESIDGVSSELISKLKN